MPKKITSMSGVSNGGKIGARSAGMPVVNRDVNILQSPVDGLYPYNNRLFNCETDDSIVAFSLINNVHPFLELFNISNSNVYKKSQAFLTYVAGEGAAAGTAGNGVVADACGDAEGIEAGFVMCEIEGFGRLRREGFTRDMTERTLKYTEIDPRYRIDGYGRIEDDFEYDMVRMASVMLQDLHRGFFSFDSVNAGQFDGILQWVTFGFTDPKTGIPHPEMDSYVVDWNSNVVCDFTNGATAGAVEGVSGVSYNGNLIPPANLANVTLIDLIKSYVTRVSQRIHMSSVSGSYNFVGALDPALLRDIIDCYVCYTVCGRDISRLDSVEARVKVEELRKQLGTFGAVTLSFDGHNVTFFEWVHSDDLKNTVNGTYSLFLTVPKIGNYNVWNFEFLDLGESVLGTELNDKEYIVSDNGRWLTWAEIEKMCYIPYMETRPRLWSCAGWVHMLVTNISVTEDIFGAISADPLSDVYLGMNTANYNLEAGTEFN